MRCHGLHVVNKNDNLSLTDDYNTNDLAGLFKVIPKNKPISLLIHGSGVLDKPILNLVPGETGISKKAIPGLDLQDYYTSEHSYSNHGWVGLVKRTLAHDILRRFEENGFSVIELSIGLCGINPLVTMMDLDPIISLGNQSIGIEEKELKQISVTEPLEQDVQINDQSYSSLFLPAYGAALNYFISADCITDDVEALTVHQSNFKYGARTRKVLQAGLALLLLLALGNAYFFNDAYQQNEKIAVTVQAQRPLLEKVSALKAQRDQLEQAIGPLNLDITTHAYIIDQIGASLDGSQIILESLELFPLLSDRKKVNAGKFEFDESEIVITGVSKDPRRFGEWVNRLRALDWVASVEISPFQKNVDGKDRFVVRVGI